MIKAIRMEGLTVPNRPFPIIQFNNPNSLDEAKIMSDADMGGYSKARLTYHEKAGTEPAHARFHGSISTELPPNRQDIQRSGYAAWRTHDRSATLFGKSLWDIDPYAFLALRIKSDGRRYFVNIQTESIVPTDIHQHRLYTQTPGEWETVVLNFNEFVRTNYGMVVEPQKEMMRQRVRSFGIGLIDRVTGPFDLSISEIYATNHPDATSVRVSALSCYLVFSNLPQTTHSNPQLQKVVELSTSTTVRVVSIVEAPQHRRARKSCSDDAECHQLGWSRDSTWGSVDYLGPQARRLGENQSCILVFADAHHSHNI